MMENIVKGILAGTTKEILVGTAKVVRFEMKIINAIVEDIIK